MDERTIFKDLVREEQRWNQLWARDAAERAEILSRIEWMVERAFRRLMAVHPSHRMSKIRTEIRAPAGTPRFYAVRNCIACLAEQSEHPAGQFADPLLHAPCIA